MNKQEEINELKSIVFRLENELNGNYEEQIDDLIQEVKERIFKLSLFLTDEYLEYPEIEKIIEGLEGELISLLETKDELYAMPVDESNERCGCNVSNEKESVLEEDYCMMCGYDDNNNEDEAYEPDQDDYNEIQFCCPYCKIEYLEEYIGELEEVNNYLENKVEEIEDKIDMLEAKIETLKEHIDYLTENIEIQEQDNENLFDENVNLIELLQEKDKEIGKLRGQCNIVLNIGDNPNKINGGKRIANGEFMQRLIDHISKNV